MSKKAKYWIYHIPGVKIGVSNQPDVRTKIQGFSEYEILEEHTNVKIVSEREQELQRQYGYPVDKIAYWKTLKWQKKGSTPKARKKAVANTDWESKVANTDYSNNKPPQSAYTFEAQTKRIANTDFKKLSDKRILKLQKSVNQYDLEDNFIQKWDSASKAGKAFGTVSGTNITACCKGKLKTAYKFKWKYAN